MSFFKKRYIITDWRGNKHLLTAKALYERVSQGRKSDYDWIASATELVRVCNESTFPENYANAIKIIILNCFANLELQKEYRSRGKETDKAAVYSCYNSLSGDDETATKVKNKYLTSIITAITRYTKSEVRLLLHPGPTYKKLCEEWKQSKFDEYVSKAHIDFDELREILYDDFEKMIKLAEEAGAFEEDDAKHRKELRKFWESIDLEDF